MKRYTTATGSSYQIDENGRVFKGEMSEPIGLISREDILQPEVLGHILYLDRNGQAWRTSAIVEERK